MHKNTDLKILLIDDDSSMIDLLQLLLAPTQVDIRSATNGLDGVRMVREHKPDVILLDLMMPDWDGWKTTAEIRKFCSAPIIVLSVVNNPRIIAQALDAGADDYLIKPVPRSELIAHINNLARRTEWSKKDSTYIEPKFQTVYK